jgi:glycosyltransferase involved in cell wall biosynthesis
MTKLAFVPPWYGHDIPGGAEALARRTAEELHRRGVEVEVLTTCAHGLYSDWGRDYYPEAVTQEMGVTVRRFAVRKRDRSRFDAVNLKLMQGARVTPREERAFIEEMVHSDRLYRYIADHRDDYNFLFLPYMFGTTVRGARICPERSWLIPCLHDEAYARLSIYAPVFRSVQGHLFLSRPEMALAQRLYGLNGQQLILAGAGVDTDYAGDAAAFRARSGIAGPFILYAGRKDVSKNLPLLMDYYRRYRHERERAGSPSALTLVLIGGGPLTGSPEEGILDLGRLSEREKFDAYAAATVLCQPSAHESFSLVMMEAWLAGTPSLVNAACEVTVAHCRESNGGLYFRDYAEFAACLDLIVAQPRLRERMARLGRAHVLAHYTWDTIAETYMQLLMEDGGRRTKDQYAPSPVLRPPSSV